MDLRIFLRQLLRVLSPLSPISTTLLLPEAVTQIIHNNVGSVEGLIAAHYYQIPSEEMFMVGITGTNGKDNDVVYDPTPS